MHVCMNLCTNMATRWMRDRYPCKHRQIEKSAFMGRQPKMEQQTGIHIHKHTAIQERILDIGIMKTARCSPYSGSPLTLDEPAKQPREPPPDPNYLGPGSERASPSAVGGWQGRMKAGCSVEAQTASTGGYHSGSAFCTPSWESLQVVAGQMQLDYTTRYHIHT